MMSTYKTYICKRIPLSGISSDILEITSFRGKLLEQSEEPTCFTPHLSPKKKQEKKNSLTLMIILKKKNRFELENVLSAILKIIDPDRCHRTC